MGKLGVDLKLGGGVEVSTLYANLKELIEIYLKVSSDTEHISHIPSH